MRAAYIGYKGRGGGREMARGKAGKEELVGEGDAKLPDWEGQPIRNLRSIKLEREVRTRLSFIDARLFLSSTALSLFFNPRSRPSHPFVHSSFAPVLATPFCISRNADTPAGDPLDSPGVWILTGDKRGEESNEISTSFTVKVCLILKCRPRDGKLLNAQTNAQVVSIKNNSEFFYSEEDEVS